MNANDIISEYIKTRDFIAEKDIAYKEAIKPFKDKLADLELQMLTVLTDLGSESIRTPEGTAYETEKVSVTCADKAAFMDYVRDHDAFELLDVRPNKTAVQDFLNEMSDLPPGVNIRRERACNFRRS